MINCEWGPQFIAHFWEYLWNSLDKVPNSDSMTYRCDDSLDEEAFVSCDPVTLVISIILVHYMFQGEQCKETFWVVTVIQQPWVDVVRCFECLGKPLSISSLMDIRLANERRN